MSDEDADSVPDDHRYLVDQLAEATVRVLPSWFRRCIVERCAAAGRRLDAEDLGDIDVAVAEMAAETGERLRRFLALDVDEQRSNPLAVLRSAVAGPTRLLTELGIPPVDRGDFERRIAPGDDYDLSPATWRDIDESLHEPGLMWGAWKAATILRRRRSEGRS